MQEAMARQAPTYAAHIAQLRQQAQQETLQEQGRLRAQLTRLGTEMQQLQACCDADRQATKDLMEVEKIQVSQHLCPSFGRCHLRFLDTAICRECQMMLQTTVDHSSTYRKRGKAVTVAWTGLLHWLHNYTMGNAVCTAHFPHPAGLYIAALGLLL